MAASVLADSFFPCRAATPDKNTEPPIRGASTLRYPPADRFCAQLEGAARLVRSDHALAPARPQKFILAAGPQSRVRGRLTIG